MERDDIPGDFIQSDMYKYVFIWIDGTVDNLISWINYKIYQNYIFTQGGGKLLNKLYDTLETVLIL